MTSNFLRLRRFFGSALTDVHAVAVLLCLAVFLALAALLWPSFGHWPRHWWLAAALAWLALTLTMQLLLNLGQRPALGGWDRAWRGTRVLVLCGLAVAGTGLWLQMQPARHAAQGMTQRFVCAFKVADAQLEAATTAALLASAPAPGPAAIASAVSPHKLGKQGKPKSAPTATPEPECQAISSTAPLPSPDPATAGVASHKLVHCAPMGPGRCETVAWLNTAQASRLACRGNCTGLKVAPSNPGNGATPDAAASADTKPGDTVSLIATVLGVVLAVVTLIATKTAADARNEVREEVAKLDVARRARGDATVARAAMLVSVLVSHVQMLNSRLNPRANCLAQLTKLIALLRPLVQLMQAMPALLAGDADPDQVLADSGKVLDMLELTPLRSYPPELLDATLRRALRGMASLIQEQAAALGQSGMPTSDAHSQAWDALQRVRLRLADV